LATSGDFAALSQDIADSAARYDQAVAQAETKADAEQAYADLLAEMGASIDGTAADIEKRYAEMSVAVADIGTKAASGPQGWAELLGIVAGSVLAGGAALNKHRNGTRARDLGKLKA